jgi:hypothetical protein
MKTRIFIGTLLLVVFAISCGSQGDNVTRGQSTLIEKITRAIFYPIRSGSLFFPSKKNKLARDLYSAVYGGDNVAWLQRILSAGADPNYCLGECGWIDANPLNVIADSFYDTYYRHQRGEMIPNPAPDVATLTLLLNAGANISKRPYIWDRVYRWNDSIFNQTIEKGEEPSVVVELKKYFIHDANRLLKAFLEAGADPDMRGDPYPFSSKAVEAKITDEQANAYFKKGSRAINVAIEKGSAWETQVDLLLKYTKLDQESLEAAKRSNDPKMIAKITKLWVEQTKSPAH